MYASDPPPFTRSKREIKKFREKPTMGRIALASILLSLFLTAIFIGGRLMRYGVEKVTSDWYFYVGFFVFAFVGLIVAMLVGTKLGGAGK